MYGNQSAASLSETPPSWDFDPSAIDTLLRQRAEEGREALITRLVMINVGALLVGAVLSYALARRSLSPIERTMDAQKQFVSDVSHELRTPLTALLATNEVALRGTKLSATESKELITHNIEEVQKLHRLTDSMLDLLKHDASVLTVAPVTLQDVVRDAMNSIVQLASNKDIKIDDQTGSQIVLADSFNLTRVVTILLDNAIKYSPTGSTIHLTSAIQGKRVVLMVRDEGIGIDPQDMPHIFTRLYRADKARGSSETGGYGLGLAIAVQVMERMQGSIHADSIPGSGSTFTLSLRPAPLP